MTKVIKFKTIFIIGFVIFAALAIISHAAPSGPTVTYLFNETKPASAARLLNTSGGSITTMALNATTQNPRWKAYVGNVTGTLTLDDANDNTLFQWSLTSVTGEVYATRAPGSLNWSGTNCSNASHMSLEELALNLSNKDDNISRTFNTKIHNGFYVGTREILTNSCFSVHTFINSTTQQSRFEEVVLYDGTNETNGNIIFSTILEQDKYGFDNNTYDFQMILPENGLPTWSSSTAYYFYVELT